jgi:hypothetical protein
MTSSQRFPDFWFSGHLPFSFVPEQIENTIRLGGAVHPHFGAMQVIAATLVRRHKRMRIWLQARQHRLMPRSNLRSP